MIGLQIPSFTDENTGITVSDAFASISRFTGNHFSTMFFVDFYASMPSDENQINSFTSRTYDVPTNIVVGSNPTLAVYQHLQTLPDFIGSTFISE